MFNSMRKWLLSLLLGIAAGSAVYAADPAPADKGKPYPLTTCVVSGEKLDSMGKPHVIQYEGREVRFCCAACEKDFRKDPKPFLKKIDDAAGRAATQPSAPGEKHDDHKNG
jgi:YHS domain-containing protein